VCAAAGAHRSHTRRAQGWRRGREHVKARTGLSTWRASALSCRPYPIRPSKDARRTRCGRRASGGSRRPTPRCPARGRPASRPRCRGRPGGPRRPAGPSRARAPGRRPRRRPAPPRPAPPPPRPRRWPRRPRPGSAPPAARACAASDRVTEAAHLHASVLGTGEGWRLQQAVAPTPGGVAPGAGRPAALRHRACWDTREPSRAVPALALPARGGCALPQGREYAARGRAPRALAARRRRRRQRAERVSGARQPARAAAAAAAGRAGAAGRGLVVDGGRARVGAHQHLRRCRHDARVRLGHRPAVGALRRPARRARSARSREACGRALSSSLAGLKLVSHDSLVVFLSQQRLGHRPAVGALRRPALGLGPALPLPLSAQP
jgi:hypothetical protein